MQRVSTLVGGTALRGGEPRLVRTAGRLARVPRPCQARETHGMKRTLTVILAVLLVAGCTAAGAQPLTAPTLTELAQRIDKQDTKIAALEADVNTARVRAKTATAHAVRAEALYEQAAARVAVLEAGRYLDALHPHPLDIERTDGHVMRVTRADKAERTLTFELDEPLPDALTVALADIEGLVSFDVSAVSWAAGETGRRYFVMTLDKDAADTWPESQRYWPLRIEPTVTLGDVSAPALTHWVRLRR